MRVLLYWSVSWCAPSSVLFIRLRKVYYVSYGNYLKQIIAYQFHWTKMPTAVSRISWAHVSCNWNTKLRFVCVICVHYLSCWTCMVPENVVSWESNFDNVFFFLFFSWWGEGGSKYHYKRAFIGLPAKRHLNGVSLTCWWWPNIEHWMLAW